MRSFSAFGRDIETTGVLDAAAHEVAVENELILISGDGSASHSPQALNSVLQLRRLGHDNVLLLSDSARSCEALRAGLTAGRGRRASHLRARC